MDKQVVIELSKKMEEIKQKRRSLAVRNTNIDQKVENERRGFSEQEEREYMENQEQMRRYQEEYDRLEKQLKEILQNNPQVRKQVAEEAKKDNFRGILSMIQEVEKAIEKKVTLDKGDSR